MREVEYLIHFGKKGQTWYVRNYQTYEIRPTRSGKIGVEHIKGKEQRSGEVKKESTNIKGYVLSRDEQLALGVGLAAAAAIVGVKAIKSIRDKIEMDKADAKADENVKIEDLRRSQNTKIDKETGFRLKNSDEPELEDMRHVNPNRGRSDGSGDTNCMFCTVAWEMRKRGYDVQALQSTRGFNNSFFGTCFKEPKEVDIESRELKFKDRFMKYDIYSIVRPSKVDQSKIWDTLDKEPVGSRGYIGVDFINSYMGHAMYYEVTKDGPVISDTQQVKQYTRKKKCKFLDDVAKAQLIRLDNLELDVDGLKKVVK